MCKYLGSQKNCGPKIPFQKIGSENLLVENKFFIAYLASQIWKNSSKVESQKIATQKIQLRVLKLLVAVDEPRFITVMRNKEKTLGSYSWISVGEALGKPT